MLPTDHTVLIGGFLSSHTAYRDVNVLYAQDAFIRPSNPYTVREPPDEDLSRVAGSGLNL